jgi:type I restriction enzyme R subunit
MLINKINENMANKTIFKIKKISGDAIESNIKGFCFLKNGIKVYDQEEKRDITIYLFSKIINQNVFQVIRQFNISNGTTKRIPDVVAFINGLPISILELKSPLADEHIDDAFKQNQTLKRFIPELYTFNIFDVISNQLETKYGSITSGFKRYFSTKQ